MAATLKAVSITGHQKQHPVFLQVEIADTFEEHKNGLMFRTVLPENQGMLFMYDDNTVRYMWMKNTYIPLDILFISENHIITHIARNARPHDLTPVSSLQPVRYVLEIAGGSAEKYDITIGDKVHIMQ